MPQFQTTATIVRNHRPVPAELVIHLTDQIAVLIHQPHQIAAVVEFALEIPNRIDVAVHPAQERFITRDDQITARRNLAGLGKGELHAVSKMPARQRDRAPAAIMQFDKLALLLRIGRREHDFIDDNVHVAFGIVRLVLGLARRGIPFALAVREGLIMITVPRRIEGISIPDRILPIDEID